MNEMDRAVGFARILASVVPSTRIVELPPVMPTNAQMFDVLVRHTELRSASRKLFMDDHYAKAVEEGEKALIEHVQARSGRPDLDGTGAMTTVFSPKSPILKVNSGQSRWEKDEQEGYMHHFAGCVLMARNPRAHNHRLVDSPQKALSVLAFINHLFDVVDTAQT